MNIQSLARLLMLVLASFGASPLWLHHALHHHGQACCHSTFGPGTSSSAERSEQTRSCCASHCHRDEAQHSQHSDKTPSSDRVISAGEHDCWVCFTLGQSQQTTFEVDIPVAQSTVPVIEFRLVNPHLFTSGQLSARGPPSASLLV